VVSKKAGPGFGAGALGALGLDFDGIWGMGYGVWGGDGTLLLSGAVEVTGENSNGEMCVPWRRAVGKG
jgi:hypothetical protein